MTIKFFSRLPLHGETQFIPGDNRNRGDWNRHPSASTGAVSRFQIGDDFTYIDYLSQVGRAAEINGFDGALLVNAPFGEEPWTIASTLARETKRLKFVTAFHPGHFSPWQATQMAATFQRTSGNRMVWNLIQGGSDALQRSLGELLPHDDRYARAIEFLDMVKGFWSNESFHYKGRFYEAHGAGLRGPLAKAKLPIICTAGVSDGAKELAAKHADYYLVLAEESSVVAQNIADVKERAAKYGRADQIRFGVSVDAIARETDEAAYAEAKRFFDEGVRAGTVQATAERSEQMSEANRSRYKRYNGREVNDFDDLFIEPHLWGGFSYIGIPPGFAFVGSYENVVKKIRQFADLGLSWFFINGYPHLEEIYRLGEHVLPHFRHAAVVADNDVQPLPLVVGGGLEARGNS
ncbi:MAG: LLM class flavin-dependent oxidoreductase [Novosphingobium sp.]